MIHEVWWPRFLLWLSQFGLSAIHLMWNEELMKQELANTLCLVGGPSPRSVELPGEEPCLHACIYKGAQPVHDPHPEGGFFAGKTPVDVIVLIPIDPAVVLSLGTIKAVA